MRSERWAQVGLRPALQEVAATWFYAVLSCAMRSRLAIRSARSLAHRPIFITRVPACEVMRAARVKRANRSRLERAVSNEGEAGRAA